MIYTVRTTSGREDIVIDILSSKIRAEALDIKALFHAAEVKGYIFIEGDLGAVHKAIHGMMHIRGLIEKPVKLEEIQHFLEYKKARIKAGIGDTVEIIGGPFKGEKGKIKRIDKAKDEVTIELLEATIPIPVTIATEFIKILKRVKPEEKPEEEPKEHEEAKEEKPEEKHPEEKEPEKPLVEERSQLEEIVKGFKEEREAKEKAAAEEKPAEEAAEKPEEEKPPEEEPEEEKEEKSELEKALEKEKAKKKHVEEDSD